MVTEVSIIPDSKTQFKVCFKAAAQITDGDSLRAIMERRVPIAADLTRPYSQPVASEAPQSAAKPTKVAGRR
jgi:hypothetical protein